MSNSSIALASHARDGKLDCPILSSALKPGELTQKDQGDIAGRPVALFGDDQLGQIQKWLVKAVGAKKSHSVGVTGK